MPTRRLTGIPPSQGPQRHASWKRQHPARGRFPIADSSRVWSCQRRTHRRRCLKNPKEPNSHELTPSHFFVVLDSAFGAGRLQRSERSRSRSRRGPGSLGSGCGCARISPIACRTIPHGTVTKPAFGHEQRGRWIVSGRTRDLPGGSESHGLHSIRANATPLQS